MKRIYSDLRNLSRDLRNTLNYLFIPENDPQLIYIFLVIITLAAVILRLLVINNPIGYDEAYTFINFSSKPFKFILADYHAPNNHILNSLLIGIAYRMLGNHIWIVRAPAFTASILGIPASYFAARRYFSISQALATSAILAVYPDLIKESVNGRGYPLVILFSLLLLNFAGILVKQQSRAALVAYAITGALGFYSIPIFLYPMAGISLWVAATFLVANGSWKSRWSNLRLFLGSCITSGLLTLILYSPVIIFGTGLKSLVGNDIVKPLTWYEFTDSINPRITKTWSTWMVQIHPTIEYLLIAGFLISLIFYRKVSHQKIPLQISITISVGILLVLQRVAPLPRIWSFLEVFFLFFSATGLLWLVSMSLHNYFTDIANDKVLTASILLIITAITTTRTINALSPEAIADQTVAPEQFAAEYLAQHITQNDTIVAVAPTDIQTAYYLKINNVPYDFFYQRDHPVKIRNALVLVRKTVKFNTLKGVLDFYDLTPSLNMDLAKVIFEYGPLQIYSIPSK